MTTPKLPLCHIHVWKRYGPMMLAELSNISKQSLLVKIFSFECQLAFTAYIGQW